MVKRAIDAFQNARLMDEFVPTPPDLLREGVESHGGPNEEANNRIRAENLAKHGYTSWYDYHIAKWGTKWDVGGEYGEILDESNEEVSLRFDSAWSPPLNFYAALEGMGFQVDAAYNESGMCFCGTYADGQENTIEIKEYTEDWIKGNVPDHLIELFCLMDFVTEIDEE